MVSPQSVRFYPDYFISNIPRRVKVTLLSMFPPTHTTIIQVRAELGANKDLN